MYQEIHLAVNAYRGFRCQGDTKAPRQGSECSAIEAIDSLNLQQFRSIPKLLLAAFMVNLVRKNTCLKKKSNHVGNYVVQVVVELVKL